MTSGARNAVMAWLALMGLSIAMALVADVRSDVRLGPVLLVALGVVMLLKTRLILRDYLALREVPGALAGFLGGIALVVTIVVAAFVLVRG